MFRDSSQRGRLSIFYSVGSKPLNNWETHIKDGYITRFLDPELKSMVVEIGGVNVNTSYMVCPTGKQVLGISMPFLVMIIKNMKKYFAFEVTILDETGTRRRFRVANFQSQTQILPLSTVMPINLADGWNQVQFNLYEFTKRAYDKHFVEVQKVKINANIRLRRIYFAEKLVPEDELPLEYKIFVPPSAKDKRKLSSKELAAKTSVERKPSVVIKEKTPSIKSLQIDVIKPSSKEEVKNAASQTQDLELSASKGEVVQQTEVPEVSTVTSKSIMTDAEPPKVSESKELAPTASAERTASGNIQVAGGEERPGEDIVEHITEEIDETAAPIGSAVTSKSVITERVASAERQASENLNVPSSERVKSQEKVIEETDVAGAPPASPVTSKSVVTEPEMGANELKPNQNEDRKPSDDIKERVTEEEAPQVEQ